MNKENNLKISLYDGEIDLDRVKEDNIEKPSLCDKIDKAKERAKDINKYIKLDNKVEMERN